jgi:hypothetical protein
LVVRFKLACQGVNSPSAAARQTPAPTRVVRDTVNDARKRAAELLETQQASLFPPLPPSLSAASGRYMGEAVPGLTLGEAGLFQRALDIMGSEDKPQRGDGRRREGRQLAELMVSCVATLFLVQRCCDAGVAEAGVLWASLDHMMQSLRPQCQGNSKFLRSIEASVASVKQLCLSEGVAAPAPAAAAASTAVTQ